ncbi:MAG: hypothetical protein ACRD16_08355 [Thermoanaerobaculia bacterium]
MDIKTRFGGSGWAVCAAVLATISIGSVAVAQDGATSASPCSNATLQGGYGFTIQGSQTVGGPLAGPVAGAAISFFDGQGGFTQHDAVMHNGTLVSGFESGSYLVDSDCSGQFTFLNAAGVPIRTGFVIDDGGKEIRTVVLNPGTTISSIGRKQ